MPWGLRDFFTKPPTMGGLDELLNSLLEDRDKRHALRQKMEEGWDLVAAAEQAGLSFTQQDRNHILADWFGQEPWWPGADTARVVGTAVIEACHEAAARGVRIDSYLACSPGNTDVSASVSWSAQQVTVVINTPPPPDSSRGPHFRQPIKLITSVDGEIVVNDRSR